jgi:polyisoprenyl-phosphate glycosyltransferase
MKTTSIPLYSVIVPVYNSEQTIEELVSRIEAVMTQYAPYELLLIDDFSTDGSWRKLNAIKQNRAHIRLIRLTKNFGQAATTLCGINESRAEVMITIDDDLQYPPEEIPKLIANFNPEEQYLLFGVPEKQAGTALQLLGSVIAKWLLNRFVLNQSKEMKFSTFRIIAKKKHRKEVYNEKGMRNIQIFFTMVSPLLMDYIYVKHLPRKSGKSNYSLFKKVTILSEVLTINSKIPLLLMVIAILVFGALAVLIFACGWLPQFNIIPKTLFWGFAYLAFAIGFTCLAFLFMMLKKLYLYNSGAETYAIWEEK